MSFILFYTNFSGLSEIRDYARLQAIGIPLPELIACDRAQERILKEFIDGETVYSLLLQDALPETCLDQVRAMCAILYPANTNIDYFPTNFVLQDGRLYYIDYECNDYMEQWDFEHWGIKYWSRTPEFLQYAKETSTWMPYNLNLGHWIEGSLYVYRHELDM